jgi:transcriptional regulator with XRE-family HTH domain
MKDRLEELLSTLQLSSAQFADIIGVQRSSISHIMSGRNKPSFDFIHKILLKFPEIDADWLITGRGEPLKASNSNDLDSTNSHSAIEPDLFDQNANIQSINSLNTSKKNDDIGEIITSKNTNKHLLNSGVTNVNSVKSVILVYNDDSFKVLNSR